MHFWMHAHAVANSIELTTNSSKERFVNELCGNLVVVLYSSIKSVGVSLFEKVGSIFVLETRVRMLVQQYYVRLSEFR